MSMITDGEYGEKLTTLLNFAEKKDTPAYLEPDVLYYVSIGLHDMNTIYTREVYNVLAFLGDLGGTFASVTFLGFVIHQFITGYEDQ